MTRIADFIRSIENGTADEGAQMALWHLIKLMNGRAVIDHGEPPPGWKLRTLPHPHSRYVIVIAEAEPS